MEAIQTKQPSAAEVLLKLALREDVRTHAKAVAVGWEVKLEARPQDAARLAEWEARMY